MAGGQFLSVDVCPLSQRLKKKTGTAFLIHEGLDLLKVPRDDCGPGPVPLSEGQLGVFQPRFRFFLAFPIGPRSSLMD